MAESETKKAAPRRATASTTKKIIKKVVAVAETPVEIKTSATAEKKAKPESKRPNKARKVRDSYTMPATDYALLTELKKSCQQAGLQVKKGEILRAGLHMLAKQTSEDLLSAVKAIQQG